MQTAQYVLSRPFVWEEGEPRDSERRSTVLMLAAEVREAIAPTLGTVPNDRQIVMSEAYRNILLVALNPSYKPTVGTAETPAKEIEPKTTVSLAIKPLTQSRISKLKPKLPSPSMAQPSSTPWIIIVVLIASATGLLELLAKNQK